MSRGLVSKLQRYSTKDGPGLRTTVFLSGCNLTCKWCANPDLISTHAEVLFHQERCVKCGECVKHANNDSIQIKGDHLYIDRKLCSNIDDMVEICPYGAFSYNSDYMNNNELSKQLTRDLEFYEESGGGITFSGGEAGLQIEFVLDVMQQLKQNNIHIALDTAGLLSKDNFIQLLNYVDLVLFDLKAFDPYIHQQCTGVSNKQILNNFILMNELGIESYVRMIIVPNENDSLLDIRQRLEFIKKYGSHVSKIDILKYHDLGISKYYMLQKEYTLPTHLSVSDELVDQIQNLADELDLTISFEN